MPATRYKLWGVGPPVGFGVTGAVHVGVAGIAKAATPNLPFVVSNEMLCMGLANLIKLPVPPSFLIDMNGTANHVSLNFNLAGQSLPPADPVALVAAHPRLAVGIILFDIWVFNADRHNGNIAYDQSSNQVNVFDHSHAFMHGNNEIAVHSYFESAKHTLSIGGHCLANCINSFDGAYDWINKIQNINKMTIVDLIKDCVEVGFPVGLTSYVLDLLLERRVAFESLIQNDLAQFPNAVTYPWAGYMGDGI